MAECIARRRARKVRAPQGKMPANGWTGQPDGQCHRKEDSRPQSFPENWLTEAHSVEQMGVKGERAAYMRRKRGLNAQMPTEASQSWEKLKRCGKSAPVRRQRRSLANPIWSKRK